MRNEIDIPLPPKVLGVDSHPVAGCEWYAERFDSCDRCREGEVETMTVVDLEVCHDCYHASEV